MSDTQPYDWATDTDSGFTKRETKISEEKNPYKRGSMVGSAFDPPMRFPEVSPEISERVELAVKVILDQQNRRVEAACKAALASGCGVLIIESGGTMLYASPCELVPPMQRYIWKHEGNTEDLQNLINLMYADHRTDEAEDGAEASTPDERTWSPFGPLRQTDLQAL